MDIFFEIRASMFFKIKILTGVKLLPLVFLVFFGKLEAQQSYEISDIQFLEDTSGKLTIDSIVQTYHEKQFKRGDVFSSKFPVWIKFAFPKNIPEGEYCLSIRADFVILYFRQNNNWEVTKTGILLDPSLRSNDVDEYHVCFPLTQDEKVIYLRIEDISGLSLELIPKSKVTSAIAIDRNIFFGISGAIVLIILINFSVYVFLKKSSFLRFSLFQSCYFFMLNKATLSQYMSVKIRALLSLPFVHNGLFILGPLSLLYFGMSYFQLSKKSSRWLTFFYIVMVMSIPCFATLPLHSSLNTYLILLYNVLVIVIVFLYSAISFFKFKSRPSLYFFIGISFVLVVAFLYSFSFLGNLRFENASTITNLTLFLFGFVLTIGMAERFGQLNKELVERRIQEQQTFYESKILEIRNQELLEENLIISGQKSQIEEQSNRLDEMNKNKDKLFSIIGHDLRGPLNSFLAFSHLLLNHVDSLSKEEIKKMSAELNDSLTNLKILLENLLDWSRSQIGHVDFTPKAFDFSQLIRHNMEVLASLATIKRIKIENGLAEPIIVFAHKHSINTVVNNLLSNAIKFTPIGGKIVIGASFQEGYVEVSFQDSGVGISPHVMANLFKIGSKITTLGTANEKGTGLGLILTKEFIEKNGGSIWVESKEGIGSSFYFTLPLGNYKNKSV